VIHNDFDKLKKGIVAVDICSGLGGLTRGLLDAGIQVIKGYDIDPRLKETYEKNNKGVKFYCKDVRDITGNEILKDIDRENNYLLLAACVPCQPFSQQNKPKKKKTKDYRKYLLDEFIRLIGEIKPDFIFLENVPGLKTRGKRLFNKLLRIIRENKYSCAYDILDAKDYGVPQKRRRLILLASKHGMINLPEKTHGPEGSGKKPYVTVRDTIAKYPRLRVGKKSKIIPNHECRDLAEINKERMRYVKKDGGSRVDFPAHLWLKCHKGHNGHSDVYGRMKWDDVSPTLTCKCTSITNGRFGHPTQTRGISVREAAALQTFKDNYVFYDCLSISTVWIGNSVPVKFAKIFGNCFINAANVY
jgi:DNA (cytosine-5)-methyltransferase 1